MFANKLLVQKAILFFPCINFGRQNKFSLPSKTLTSCHLLSNLENSIMMLLDIPKLFFFSYLFWGSDSMFKCFLSSWVFLFTCLPFLQFFQIKLFFKYNFIDYWFWVAFRTSEIVSQSDHMEPMTYLLFYENLNVHQDNANSKQVFWGKRA